MIHFTKIKFTSTFFHSIHMITFFIVLHNFEGSYKIIDLKGVDLALVYRLKRSHRIEK